MISFLSERGAEGEQINCKKSMQKSLCVLFYFREEQLTATIAPGKFL